MQTPQADTYIAEEKAYCLSTNGNASGRNAPLVLVLNDQGGGVMHVSYDKTSTLRAETKHHEPIVLVYESHNQDSRYRHLGDICETVNAKYGTGGGNQPIVLRYEETVQQSQE